MATITNSAVSFKFPPMLIFLFLVLVLQSQLAKSQDTCPGALANLSVCAPYVVPGPPSNGPPNSDCCKAIKAVPQECYCNTVRIASRLPSRCNLPVFNCSVAN